MIDTVKYFNVSDWTVDKIDYRLAKSIVVENHYSHSMPSAEVSLGLYYKDRCAGVVVYGPSASSKMKQSLPSSNYLELVRLFAFDWTPKNVESYLIGQSIKWIRNHRSDIKVLVSFADPSEGHFGTIYQATNWLYCGKSLGDKWYIIDGKKTHPRSVVAKYGTRSEPKLRKMGVNFSRKTLEGKHRYIYIYTRGVEKRETRLVEKTEVFRIAVS